MTSKSKAVKMWGLIWKNKITPMVDYTKKSLLPWCKNSNYKVVRVEIKEIRK